MPSCEKFNKRKDGETIVNDRVLIEHPVAAVRPLLPSLVGRIAVVTGASSGLGAETAKWLALRGCDEVVFAVRNPSKAQAVLDELVAQWGERVPDLKARLTIMEMDLASLASVRAFAAAFAQSHTHLDILVNNAGVNVPMGSTTADGFDMMWGTNHLGPVCLTAASYATAARCTQPRCDLVVLLGGGHFSCASRPRPGHRRRPVPVAGVRTLKGSQSCVHRGTAAST